MKYLASRKIDRIAIPITRACNRNCPECSAVERPEIYGKGDREPHVSIQELEWVGKMLGPIGRVEITGGEPSIHPEFSAISERIHDLFQSTDIMLLTNGWRFKDESALPLLLHYDRVYVTHYTEAFSKLYGVPVNTPVHNRIRDFLEDQDKTKFWSQQMDSHKSLSAKPSPEGVNCYYWSCDSVGYNRGQIYGCCVAYGLPDRGRGIVLSKDWRRELPQINLPCETCFLNGN